MKLALALLLFQTTTTYDTQARPLAVITSQPTVFLGNVFAPGNVPAEGALVTTSFGGEAVTSADGRFELALDLPRSVQDVEVTAVLDSPTGRRLSASARIHAPLGAVTPLALGLEPDGGCSPRWLRTFGQQPGLSGEVQAMVVFDDGSGPALYAGGTITAAEGKPASGVVRWDGSEWTALPGLTRETVFHGHRPGTVNALAVFDDGNGPALYAGGFFTHAGDAEASNLARWDGSSWLPVGGGTSQTIHTMTVFDDGGGSALYVGGSFGRAGGEIVRRIARWDGSTWSPLGIGLFGPNSPACHALEVFDDGNGPALWAAGSFAIPGFPPLGGIAKWDGTTWAAHPFGLESESPNLMGRTLAVFDDGNGPALYVGGSFSSVGGVPAANIARWDGSAWSACGDGVDGGGVHSLLVFDDGTGPALYVGGSFQPDAIRRWNGASWETLAQGVTGREGSSVDAMVAFDDGSGPALWAGGRFDVASGARVNSVARWDGAWSGTGGTGLDAEVKALMTFNDGNGTALYAGGDFWGSEGAQGPVLRWDGTRWSGLESTLTEGPYTVSAFATFDDGTGTALYAASDNFVARPLGRIMKWDGSAWSPLAGTRISDFGSAVHGLEVFDDGNGRALYAGGEFRRAGGEVVNGIARWDGAGWSSLGSGVEGLRPSVWTLATFDDGTGPALYVGGDIDAAGGVPVKHVARWYGSRWSAPGAGLESDVRGLLVFDDGTGEALYASGSFGVSRWDGLIWTEIPDSGDVAAMGVFDDGTGPALFASATARQILGPESSYLLRRWDGRRWSGRPGVRANVLHAFDDGTGPALFVGGPSPVSPAGDSYLAKWGCTAPKVHSR